MDFFNKVIFIFMISRFSFINCSLKIFSPANLVERFPQNNLEISIAYFGEVPWGKTLIGSVYYAIPGDACSFIQPLHYENEPSPIVFADRGNCSYVKKAMFSQLIGAKLLIINDAYNEDTKDQLLGDDGNGDLINIPVLMIKKHDGDIIKEFLMSENLTLSTSVSVSVNFELNKLQKAEIQIWLSTSNVESYEFLEQFHKEYLKLRENLNFKPYYALWFCAYCKHNHFKIKNDNCLSGGRYCYPDPDIEGPLLGKNYVKESLRQICIFKNNADKWWDYVKLYKAKCILSQELNTCSSEILKQTKINEDTINSCMKESFEGSDEDLDDNKLLKEDHEKFKNEGIQIWPSVLINNAIYKGTLDAEVIFETICKSFTSPPEICVKLVSDLKDFKNDEASINKISKTNDNSSNSDNNLLFAVLILIIGLIAVFILFAFIIKCRIFTKTKLPQEITLNISSTVSRYFAFQDKNDKEKMIEVSA